MAGRGYGGGGPPAGSDSYYGSFGSVDGRRNVMSNVTAGGFLSSRYADGRENDVARGSEQDLWKSNSYSSFKGPEDMLRVTVGNQMYKPQGSEGPAAAAKDFGGDSSWGRAAGHQYQRTVQPVAGSLSHVPTNSGSSEWISRARHHPDRNDAVVSGGGLQSQGSAGLGGWSSQASPSGHVDVQGRSNSSSRAAAEYAESNEAFVDLRGAAKSAAEDRLRVLGLPSTSRDGGVVSGGRSSSAEFSNQLGRAGTAQLWRPLMDVDDPSTAPFEADQGRLPANRGGPKSILKHKGLDSSQPDHVSAAGMGLRGVGDTSISSGDAAAAYQAQSLLMAAAAAALQQAPAAGGGGATAKAQVFDYGHSKADPLFGNAEIVPPGDAGDRLLPSSTTDRSGRVAEGNAGALATKNFMEDPTIAGILKSIGVEFDLNKKLQEKARAQEQLAEEMSRRRRKGKTEEEMTRQFCINKTASFLEGDLDIGTVLESSALAGSGSGGGGATRPSKEAGTDHRTGPSSMRSSPAALNSSGAHSSNLSPSRTRPQSQQSRGTAHGSRDEQGSGSITWSTAAADRSPGARNSSLTPRSSSGSADHGRQVDWQQRPLSDARHAVSPSSAKGDYSSSSGSKHGETRSAAELHSTQHESGRSSSGSAARGSQDDCSRSDSYGQGSVGRRDSKDGKGKSDRESSTGGCGSSGGGSSREQRSATASGGGKPAGDGGSSHSNVGGGSSSSLVVASAAGGSVLSIEEHERLADEMEDRRRRLQLLEGELEKLRRQQNEMMRRQQRGGSSQKDGQLIAENARLQEEIGQQIAQLRRTAEANERALLQARMAAAAGNGRSSSSPSMSSLAAVATAKSSCGDSDSTGHGSSAGNMLPPQIVQGDQSKALSAVVGNAATAAALFHTLLRAWPNLMLAASQSKQAPSAATPGEQLSKQQPSKQSPFSGHGGNSSTSSSGGGGGSSKQRQQQQQTSLAVSARAQAESMVYEYYDSTTHWCKQCNVELSTLGALLEHLSSQAHQQAAERPERPWEPAELRSPASSKPAKKESSMIVKLPLKGSEFLVPAPEAFYCRLCSEFAGDARSMEAHVKNGRHYDNYKKHISENPYYERRYSLDREASARTRKRRLEEDARLADEAKRQRLDEEMADKKLELLKARRQQSAAAVGASTSSSDDKSTVVAARDASVKLEVKEYGEVEAMVVETHAKVPTSGRPSGKSAEAAQGSTPAMPADVGASTAPSPQQPAKAAGTAAAGCSSSSKAPKNSAEPSVTAAAVLPALQATVPRALENAKSARYADEGGLSAANGSAPKKMRLDETPEASSTAAKAGQSLAAEPKPAAAAAGTSRPGAASAGRGSGGQRGNAGSSPTPGKPASAASISKPPTATPSRDGRSGGATTPSMQVRPGSQKPTASAGRAAEGAAVTPSLSGGPPSLPVANAARAASAAASSASASGAGPQSKADGASVHLGAGGVATGGLVAAQAGSGAAVGSAAKPDPKTVMQPSVRLRPDDARVMARPATDGAKEGATAASASTTGATVAWKGTEQPPPDTASGQQQAPKQTQETTTAEAVAGVDAATGGKSSAATAATQAAAATIGRAGPVASSGNAGPTPGKPCPATGPTQQSSVTGSAAHSATKPATPAVSTAPPLAKAVGSASSATGSYPEATKPSAEPAKGQASQQPAKPGVVTAGSSSATQTAKQQATTAAGAARGTKQTTTPPAKPGGANRTAAAPAQSPKPGVGQANSAPAPSKAAAAFAVKSLAAKPAGDAAKQGSRAEATGTTAKPVVADVTALKVGGEAAKSAVSAPGQVATTAAAALAHVPRDAQPVSTTEGGEGVAATKPSGTQATGSAVSAKSGITTVGVALPAAPEAGNTASREASGSTPVRPATGKVSQAEKMPAASTAGAQLRTPAVGRTAGPAAAEVAGRPETSTSTTAATAKPVEQGSSGTPASGAAAACAVKPETATGGAAVSRSATASKPHDTDKIQAATAAVAKGTTPEAVKAGVALAVREAKPSSPAGLPAQAAKTTPSSSSSSTGAQPASPAVAASPAAKSTAPSAEATQAIKDAAVTASPSGTPLNALATKPDMPAGQVSSPKPAAAVQPKGPITSAKGPVTSASGGTVTRATVAVGTVKAPKTENSSSPAKLVMQATKLAVSPGGSCVAPSATKQDARSATTASPAASLPFVADSGDATQGGAVSAAAPATQSPGCGSCAIAAVSAVPATAEPGETVTVATDAASQSAQPAINTSGTGNRSHGGKPGVYSSKPEVADGSINSTVPALRSAAGELAGSIEARASSNDARLRELPDAATTAKPTAGSRSAAAVPASPTVGPAGPATRTRSAAAAAAGGGSAQSLSASRVGAGASGSKRETVADEKQQHSASHGGAKPDDRGDGDLSDLEGDGSQMSEDQCDDASMDGDFEILDEYEEEHS